MLNNPDPQFDNLEEKRVIENVENPLAIKYGQMRRTTHGNH